MSSTPRLQRLVRSSGIYAVGNAFNRLGGFLLLPLYTHFLSPEEYGALELLYTTSSVIGAILSVGIASATLRFFFDYDAQEDRHAVITTNYFASLGLSFVGSLLAWIAITPFFYKIFPSNVPTWTLALILTTTCIELSTEILLAYIRARDLALFFVGISIVKLLVQCGANIYLVRVAEAGMPGVLAGNLIAVSAEWLILSAYTIRHCGVAFHWRKLVPVLKYCFPLLLTTIVGVIQGSFDRFLAGTAISLSALGVYAVGLKFARIIVDFVGIPFGLAYGAFRFEMMKSESAGKTQGDILVYLAALLSAMGLAMIYLIDDVLRVMTSEQYWSAATLMPLLVSASIVGVLTSPLQTGILYSKKTSVLFYLSVLSAVTGCLLALALAHAMGIMGLAIAVVLTSFVTLVATGWAAQRYLATHYHGARLLTLLALWILFNLTPFALTYAGLRPSLLTDALQWLVFVGCLLLLRVVPASVLRDGLAAVRRKAQA